MEGLKTKENILQDKLQSLEKREIMEYHHHLKIIEAMDQYTKQQCISFAEWIFKNQYTPTDLFPPNVLWRNFDSKLGVMGKSETSGYYSHEELYNKFLSTL